MPAATTEGWNLRQTLAPGFRAIRDHWIPFLLIQICAAVIVVLYYQVESVREFAGTLARAKTQGGLPSSFLGTAFAGGILPEVFKLATRDTRRCSFGEVVYNATIFGIIGVIVDLFYQGQGIVFGNEITFKVVLIKVLVDQLLFSPIIFNPFAIFLFQLRPSGFRIGQVFKDLGPNFIQSRVLTLVIVGWSYWFPVLAALYALPRDLQFVFYLFIEAAWSLILVHIVKSMRGEH